MTEKENLDSQKETLRFSLDSKDLFAINGCLIGSMQEILPCLPVVTSDQASAMQATVHFCVMIQSSVFHQALNFNMDGDDEQDFLFKRAEIHFIAHQLNRRIESLRNKKEEALRAGYGIPESLTDAIDELSSLMDKLPKVEVKEPSKIITNIHG